MELHNICNHNTTEVISSEFACKFIALIFQEFSWVTKAMGSKLFPHLYMHQLVAYVIAIMFLYVIMVSLLSSWLHISKAFYLAGLNVLFFVCDIFLILLNQF